MGTNSTQQDEETRAGIGSGELVRRMDPSRFVVGQRVQYWNHVVGYDIALLEVKRVDNDYVVASRFFNNKDTLVFHADGKATWSTNLSIKPA